VSRWILLRGLTRDRHHWGEFPATLAAATGVPAIPLDLPGNGVHWRSRSPISVRAMAEHGMLECARLGVLPPYRLLAISLGGMVALEWIRARPAEIESAVLINTSARPFARQAERLRPAAWPDLLRMLLPGRNVLRLEQAVLDLTSNLPAERRPSLLDDWVAWRAAHPATRLNALRQLLAAARYRAPRQAPAVPLLLLASDGDRLVDPACSQRMARAWGADFDRHPNAGHDLPLDDPAWVVERIRRWQRH